MQFLLFSFIFQVDKNCLLNFIPGSDSSLELYIILQAKRICARNRPNNFHKYRNFIILIVQLFQKQNFSLWLFFLLPLSLIVFFFPENYFHSACMICFSYVVDYQDNVRTYVHEKCRGYTATIETYIRFVLASCMRASVNLIALDEYTRS